VNSFKISGTASISGSSNPSYSSGLSYSHTSYPMTVTNANWNTTATVNLTGLINNTNYTYHVECNSSGLDVNDSSVTQVFITNFIDSIASTTSITVSGNINIGSGHVNESFLSANISTDKLFDASSGWVNTTASYDVNATNLTIENNGTTTVNITFSVNQSVSSWLGGTGGDARVKFIDLEAGSCTGIIPANYTLQLNSTSQAVCTSGTLGQGLVSTDTKDTIAAFVNLLIPRNLLIGTRSTTITFTAVSNE